MGSGARARRGRADRVGGRCPSGDKGQRSPLPRGRAHLGAEGCLVAPAAAVWSPTTAAGAASATTTLRAPATAATLEQAARKQVIELLRNPETLRRQVKQTLQEEIAALRNPERMIVPWASRLAETDRMRVAYLRQQAEGLMSLEELRAHLGELDERRAEAEDELAALRDGQRRLDDLRSYASLIRRAPARTS